MGNGLGKKCFNSWSSAEKNIQISSTPSNWELDGLIPFYSAPKGPIAEGSRAGGEKIQHCYPIISELMCDVRFLLDKRKHTAEESGDHRLETAKAQTPDAIAPTRKALHLNWPLCSRKKNTKNV